MPRTLSSTEYKELGKRYYGSKNYQQALDAFTEGIEASSGLDVTLFDYRAATWEKLENSQAALADGRRMIKADKKDPRGYLRTGKILERTNKEDVALNIYEYGLRNVPVTNLQLKLLQGAHDKLNRRLSPAAAIDPFTQMPLEIVELIVQYLKFYELVNCLRVCKQWKTFLTSLPSLWNDMDLYRTGRQKPVKPKFIRSCIKYAQCNIKTARLHMCSDRNGLCTLATTCKALRELELLNTEIGGDTIIEVVMIAKNLKTLKLSTAVTIKLDQVAQILKRRPTLEELQVLGLVQPTSAATWEIDLPNLRVVDIQSHVVKASVSDISLPRLNLPDLFSRAPNLTSIRLQQFGSHPVSVDIDFSVLQNLEVLKLHDVVLRSSPQLPACLRDLVLNRLAYMPQTVHGWLFHGFLPNLERLSLWGSVYEIPEIHRLLDGNGEANEVPSKLKMFGLQGYSDIFHDVQVSAVQLELTNLLSHPRLRDIEELVLTYYDMAINIDDAFAEHIADTFKSLVRLDLSGTAITGVGIKALVKKLPLRILSVTNCQHLGADAVEWARGQGVYVEQKLQNTTAGLGRRIFYGN